MTEAEKQYIDLYTEASEAIKEHSAEVMNAVRDRAFEDFRRQGFPTRKVERYKYTDMEKIFAPNYGLNINRIEFPVDPYAAFRCDVPNLSTLLYFVVNDAFYEKRLPNVQPEEGVVIGSLRKAAEEHPELIARYYARIAKTEEDAITPPFFTASLSRASAAVVPCVPQTSSPISSRMRATLSPTAGVGARERSTVPNGVSSLRLASCATS